MSIPDQNLSGAILLSRSRKAADITSTFHFEARGQLLNPLVLEWEAEPGHGAPVLLELSLSLIGARKQNLEVLARIL